MPSEEEWVWKLSPRATEQFDALNQDRQERIVSKLDDVVTAEWRDPEAHLEPLTGGPFSKLRVGDYRLACILDSEGSVLEVHRIEHRS